eukprot:TRINITY_DN2899_c0_g1_i2.p1 TRINITY_DN2899_c0_g1~~TRINITY_DN2899_c0_g1_i2.p1  ORF type:complete len:202 (+),score=64.44 TRINITY_DN2899_c0_g1_i2:3-608(+)
MCIRDSINAEYGVSHELSGMESNQPDMGQNNSCIICLTEGNEISSLSCGHPVCKDCWEKYLISEFVEKRKSFLFVTCPGTKCDQKVGEENLRKYLEGNGSALTYLDQVLRTIPTSLPPTQLSDFNYTYNTKGELLNLENGKKFHFVNQAHYDALGDFVTGYIQRLLVKNCGLEEVSSLLTPLTVPEVTFSSLLTLFQIQRG